MITDTHCHLASHQFDEQEIPSILKSAETRGVKRFICVGTDIQDSAKAVQFAQQFDPIFATVGIHPTDVTEAPKDAVAQIEELAIKHPEQVVAIGETGLDYYHPAPEGFSEEVYHQMQQESLDKHFALAAKLGLNVVMHTRDKTGHQSLDDALKIYAKYADQTKAVFHCFPFGPDQADKIFQLGGLISFTGIITYKRPPESLELALNLPTDQFMLETDSPYLAPVPHRGKRNEPGFTRDIFEFLANKRPESAEELAEKLEKTVDQFFQLN